ncbi:hypothetical protein HanHA300_Chr10g0363861 [Helianthus annuus]|nr:hypothetical protein HanHA300_Chr10g0363861 [Helianthus annuus]KAJ0530087.1 hypothetical protein HanHA89_Chr10g0385581 [Helianthus annuus]KAJ0696943.1 hypothetical protein HanLR1_Chr10g0363101 [Helianthus annuus]
MWLCQGETIKMSSIRCRSLASSGQSHRQSNVVRHMELRATQEKRLLWSAASHGSFVSSATSRRYFVKYLYN